ncbi:MAG: DUF2586 family protein [Deltaproteobacteria bacterium]|nr:DUF2586 family protein [Deltaproteobacteria bacterium]
MGDVFEHIIDGNAGIVTNKTGSVIVVGVCSLGTPGKTYTLSKDSDVEAILGFGPLTDRINDIFLTGGQEAAVIAVPVAGLPGGYATQIKHVGTGPDATKSGVPSDNADIVVEIVAPGALGTSTYRLSIDEGKTFETAESTPVNGQISCGVTGMTLVLTGDQVAGDKYAFSVRIPIGPVAKVGTGPEIEIYGDVKARAEVILRIVRAGGRNVGVYQLSVDGTNFGPERTIPIDGLVGVGDSGVTITIPETDMVLGDEYSFELIEPVPSITAVMVALETPLEKNDVEFVYIVGPSNSTDWAAMGVKSDTLWNGHRPTFFICEARMPYANETQDEWSQELISEHSSFSHRFVACCTAYGEVTDSKALQRKRNWGGLLVGRVLYDPVMRSIARTKTGSITPAMLPDEWSSPHQEALEKAGFITAKEYAGEAGVYWGEGRTLADRSSDYQFLETVRVVFKAIRLQRKAAFPSLYDEAGDLAQSEPEGIYLLKTQIENSLNTMVDAIPKEMAGHVVNIPDGQNVTENGLAVETDLVGIPNIPKITLYSKYSHAGSDQDPR